MQIVGSIIGGIPSRDAVNFRSSLTDIEVGDYLIEVGPGWTRYVRAVEVTRKYIVVNMIGSRYKISDGVEYRRSGRWRIYAVDEQLYNDTVNFVHQSKERNQVNKLLSAALEKIGDYSPDNIKRLVEVLEDMELI